MTLGVVDTSTIDNSHVLAYYVAMPVGKDSKQITAVISAADYEQLQRKVAAKRKRGQKMTMSRYIAEVLQQHWEVEKLLINNGQPR